MIVLTKSKDYTVWDKKFLQGQPQAVSPEEEEYLLSTGYFAKAADPVDDKADVEVPEDEETGKVEVVSKPATTAKKTAKTEADKSKE